MVVGTRRNTDYLKHLFYDIDIRFSEHDEERTRRNSYAVLVVHLLAYLFRDAESRVSVGSIADPRLGDNRAHVLAWTLNLVNEGFMFLLVSPTQRLEHYLKLGLCICYSPTILRYRF